MNKRMLSILSALALSTSAFGQVLSGGATGSIGGRVDGTLQRPSAIERANADRERVDRAGATATGRVSGKVDAAAAHGRDRAATASEKSQDRAATTASTVSSTAHGAVSSGQAMATDSVRATMRATGAAEASVETLKSSNEMPAPSDTSGEAKSPANVSGSTLGAIDARAVGAADGLAQSNDQPAMPNDQPRDDDSSLSGEMNLSGSGAANANATSVGGQSNAGGNARVARDGASARTDASASGQARTEVKQAN